MEIGDFGEITTCDLGDELEAAVVRGRQVYVELESGDHFVDRPVDVVTENGQDFVAFESRGRIAISDLRAVAKAGPEKTVKPTDVPEIVNAGGDPSATT